MIVQNAPNDALSDVLRQMDAQSLCSVATTIGGDWALHFSVPEAIKFNALCQGRCWIWQEGGTPQRLEAGDCFVASRGTFHLASDPAIPSIPFAALFDADGRTAHQDERDPVTLIGGSVTLDERDGGFLLEALPRLIVVSGKVPAAGPLGWLLAQLDLEWKGGQAGALLACNDLLRLMFVHLLRAYLAEASGDGANWLAGLADRHIGQAMRAIHAEPDRDWSVEALARTVGQSRSGFAAAFKARTGLSPMEYVTRWRMRLAAARLRRGQEPLSAIAQSLGYASDSAFGAAFRRVFGQSPARYRAETRRLAAIGEPN